MNVLIQSVRPRDGTGKSRKNTWRRTNLGALGRLLEGDGLLLAHGRNDRNEQILAVVEVGLDLLAHLTLRKLDVVLGSAILGHEVEEAIIDVDLVHHNFVGKYHLGDE